MLDEQIAAEEAELIFGLLGLRNKYRGNESLYINIMS